MSAGASGCGAKARRRRAPLTPAATSAGRPVIIGCIAPFSGPYASHGAIVAASLQAATGHIAADLGGSYAGYRPVIMRADAPLTPEEGQQAYTALKAQKVDAVLWCGAQGLAESLPDIVRDLTPVIAVGSDIQSRVPLDARVPDLASGAGAGFPVFQTSVPDTDAVDLLVDYARADRGFERGALVYSKTSSPGIDVAFARSCTRHGLANVGTVGYDSAGGPPDMAATAAALRRTGAQVVVIAGAAPDAAALATVLDAAGARYRDTPGAKVGPFAPMILGTATATAAFARQAGDHAAKGTVGVSTLAGVVGVPSMPVRDWISRFVPGYGAPVPVGGEDGPADALAALLGAASTAHSTRGADLVAALESGFETRFAAGVGLVFGPARHLAPVLADLCLQALESGPETRYNLGTEFHEVFPAGYRAPSLLVDFTLDRNRGAHPDMIAEVTRRKYGISRRPDYQDGDDVKIQACGAVH